MIYFDEFALILVCCWRSLAVVSHLSVSYIMSIMFLRQIYIHTEGQSGPCWGDGGGWSSRLPALAARLLGRKSKQGQSSSRQAIDMLLP